MLSIEETSDYSGDYARVSINAPIRLTVSTFLASVCLATFAVFLPNAIHISGFDLGAALVLITETLLGVASMIFLIVATVMSIIMTRFTHFSKEVRKALDEEDESFPFTDIDKGTLTDGNKLYYHAVVVMYWGLAFVVFSLPLLGLHINDLIGLTIFLVFPVIGIYFRKYLRFMFTKVR